MNTDVLQKDKNTHPDKQSDAMLVQQFNALVRRFENVRRNSEILASPLSPEDWMLQSMEEASPIKWHLAHTSWFFEAFILQPQLRGYKPFHKNFNYLFNSYYQQIGDMHRRSRRGLLSRPSASDVVEYRQHIDHAMSELFENSDVSLKTRLLPLLELGCNHEEQHQELMQTDILHALYQNALLPTAYSVNTTATQNEESHGALCKLPPCEWIAFEGGLVEKGASSEQFCFDNETPRHKFHLNPFELSNRPVTNQEYLEFMEDGGYCNPQYWLSDGWDEVQSNKWESPLYWRKGDDGSWYQYTLFGERVLPLDAPVCHVSYFEAAAFASWAGVWLPTETEWEVAAANLPVAGHFLEEGKPAALTPLMAKQGSSQDSGQNSGKGSGQVTAKSSGLSAMFGHVWEWTQSPYAAYPGYKPATGAIGEYNGKFMSNQMVLRGGSCATPKGHVRASYRNFFPPNARWQFSGFRLAR